MQDVGAPGLVLAAEGKNLLATIGEMFSYRFSIPSDPSSRVFHFEYINHTQEGRFDLHSLAWIGFSSSLASSDSAGNYDTVTFSGFGTWTKDGHRSLQQVAAQFCLNPKSRYVGIQVDGTNISNVNTKPRDEADALP